MTTLNKITEQVERLYMRSIDQDKLKPVVDRREISILVAQVTNTVLAAEPKQQSRLGAVEIPACVIATYTNQPVTSFTTPLPAYPIHLPMNMGVWHVSATGKAFIPVTSDAWDLLSDMDEGLLEGQVGYTVEGRNIKYLSDPGASTVTVKLLIVDPSSLGPHDPFPVPPELEAVVIEKTLELLSSRGLAPQKPKG